MKRSPRSRVRLRRWLLYGTPRIVAGPVYDLLIRLELAAERVADGLAPRREEPDPALLGQVTALVKTFERPAALTRLLESIRRLYPELQTLVVDDSRNPTRPEGVRTIVLPFDSGVSAGRREGLGATTTKYVLNLDDDFVFYRGTRLGRALALMERHPEIDIMGGECLDLPFFRKVDYSKVSLLPTSAAPKRPLGSRIGGLPVYDKVHNFFVGRTDRVQLVNWDPALKRMDHADFFTRARGVLTSGFNADLKVLHARTLFDLPYMTRREDLALDSLILRRRYYGDP